MSIVAFIMLVLFVCLGVLHFYWALGRKSGLDKVIPELDGKPAMEPGAIVTVIVAIALTGFGIIA